MNSQHQIDTQEFGELVPDLRARINGALSDYLTVVDGGSTRLLEAMRYSVLGEGKRLRPLLVYASGAGAGVAMPQLDSIASAIELVHAYSLVHDDLPAMDDDELRRGRATTHIAFDEATAILVGDAMQALAYEILVTDRCWENESNISCKLIEYLAKASGPSGMAGGQAMDLAAVGHTVSVAQLDEMYARKTGRLIRAAVRMPLFCDPTTSADTFAATDAYASGIGLAFQVKDDLLEIEGTTDTIGKPQGSDEKNAKPTYPVLMGVAASQKKLEQLYDEALAAIEPLGDRFEPLRWLARYVIARES